MVGFTGSPTIPKIAINRLLLKNIGFVGVHWGAYASNEPEAVEGVWRGIMSMYADGKFKPVLFDRTYMLEELADAVEAIESRKTWGKVVVQVRPPTAKL